MKLESNGNVLRKDVRRLELVYTRYYINTKYAGLCGIKDVHQLLLGRDLEYYLLFYLQKVTGGGANIFNKRLKTQKAKR